MEPVITVALLATLFVGTHIGLTTARVRTALVAAIGERGFSALFSAVAAASFAVLVAYYATHRFDGAPGLALAHVPALRWALLAASIAGIVLAASAPPYPGSPYDPFGRRIRAPRGIERITRHPFFAGMTLWAGAHALLATRLVGTVGFASLALLAVAGSRHQDRKLLARCGQPYADYLAATSGVPFGAIVAGRQVLVWRELSGRSLTAGVAVAFALRAVHDGILAHGGVWVIAAVVGGAALLTWQSWRRAHREASSAHAVSAAVRPPAGER